MTEAKRNLFASVLTYAAPSSNYRGESEENRTVLQKITKGNHEHTVISPESMRNALRDIIAGKLGPEKVNRTRLHNEEQLAVEFKEIPNAAKFADDFLFGYMVAEPKKVKNWPKDHPGKRDSVLRMNMAVALLPYRFDATFHQSPQNAGISPWKNTDNSALLHREVAHTAYQYPFALAYDDCAASDTGKVWTRSLLESIGELSNVAGGHARSYFEMAPRSIIVRLSPSLVAGFNTYGFDEHGAFPELARISANDLPGKEFWLGGEIVRQLDTAERKRLTEQGVTMLDNPQKLLAGVAEAMLGKVS